jgi:hypothetical protein
MKHLNLFAVIFFNVLWLGPANAQIDPTLIRTEFEAGTKAIFEG